MGTVSPPKPLYDQTPRGATADELTHVYCGCDPDRALCGLDISDYPFGSSPDDLECVVCADLEDFDCPRCGA